MALFKQTNIKEIIMKFDLLILGVVLLNLGKISNYHKIYVPFLDKKKPCYMGFACLNVCSVFIILTFKEESSGRSRTKTQRQYMKDFAIFY